MLAELGTTAASAPVPLLTAQMRVVKNEGEFSNNRRAPCRAVRTTAIYKSALAQTMTSVTRVTVVRTDVGGARHRRRLRAGTVSYCVGARGQERRGILKQMTRALSRSSNYRNLQERVGPNHYLSHLE